MIKPQGPQGNQKKECTIPCKHWNPNRSACKHKAFVDLTLQLQRHPQSMPSTTASWECCMLLLHAQETRRSINEKTSFWCKPRLIVVGDLGTQLPTSNYSFTSFIDKGYARFRETTPLNAFRAASGGRKFSRPGLSFFLSFWLFWSMSTYWYLARAWGIEAPQDNVTWVCPLLVTGMRHCVMLHQSITNIMLLTNELPLVKDDIVNRADDLAQEEIAPDPSDSWKLRWTATSTDASYQQLPPTCKHAETRLLKGAPGRLGSGMLMP